MQLICFLYNKYLYKVCHILGYSIFIADVHLQYYMTVIVYIYVLQIIYPIRHLFISQPFDKT